MEVVGIFTFVVILFVVIILANAIRILREYERGIIFRLGRLSGVKGPGIIFLIPIVDRMVKVSLQTLTEIASEKNSTIIFPVPIDLIAPFLENFKKKS